MSGSHLRLRHRWTQLGIAADTEQRVRVDVSFVARYDRDGLRAANRIRKQPFAVRTERP